MNSTRYKQIDIKPARQCVLAGLRAVVCVLFLASATFISSAALADNHQRTRADAVEIAKQQSGDGRVLSVQKKVNQNGVSIYAVKIITNGRVKIFSVPEFTP